MRPCRCTTCANFVRRNETCLEGHNIGYVLYHQHGCEHYSEVVYREISWKTYKELCRNCEHSRMADMQIHGIPFCNVPKKNCKFVFRGNKNEGLIG